MAREHRQNAIQCLISVNSEVYVKYVNVGKKDRGMAKHS